MPDSTPISISYVSSRGEVWRWYWRAWRRRLWRIHLAIAVLAFAAGYMQQPDSASATRRVLVALAVSLAALAILVLFPQLMFKPSQRELTIDDLGVSTRIGRQSGTRRWSEIASVERRDDLVVLSGRSGNAFIVPRRAFESTTAFETFFETAQQLHARNTIG